MEFPSNEKWRDERVSQIEQIAVNCQRFWFHKCMILISQKYGSVTVKETEFPSYKYWVAEE